MDSRLLREFDRIDFSMRALRFRALSANRSRAQEILEEHLSPSFWPRVPLLDMIVDFVHPEASIAIEIDGIYHRGQLIRDNRRDLELYQQLGIRTLRIESTQVFNDLPTALERVARFLIDPVAPVVVDRTQERKQRQKERDRERADVNALIAEFEHGMAGRPRKDVLEAFALLEVTFVNSIQREALEKIRKLVWAWPDAGYKSPGLQVVTANKLSV